MIRINRVCLVVICGVFYGASANAQEAIGGNWKLSTYRFAKTGNATTEDKIVSLTIGPGQQVGGNAGCNTYSGKLTVSQNGAITIGPIDATEKACDVATMNFENVFLRALESLTKFRLEEGRLVFGDRGGNIELRFERLVANTTIERQIIFVGNKMVKCPGIAPMKCLQIKRDGSGGWQNFYDSIVNFSFKPGLFYKIEVEKEENSHPPTGTNIYRYRLVRIIKAVKKESGLFG